MANNRRLEAASASGGCSGQTVAEYCDVDLDVWRRSASQASGVSVMTAAFVQSTLQELMRSMDDARTPWSYDVSAAWVDGEDAYVVFTTTATGSRLLGDVLNIRASLDCYGSSSAADLAHLVFALEIQSHRYYELPSVTTGLGIVNPIYWFATTAATAMVGTVDDIDRDYRRRDVQQGNSLAMTRRGSSGKALLAQQLPNAGMMP